MGGGVARAGGRPRCAPGFHGGVTCQGYSRRVARRGGVLVAVGRGAGVVTMVCSREVGDAVREETRALLALSATETDDTMPYVARPGDADPRSSLASVLDSALVVCPLAQAGRPVGIL